MICKIFHTYQIIQKYLPALFSIIIVLTWIIGPIFIKYLEFTTATGVSFALVITMLAALQSELRNTQNNSKTAIYPDQNTANEQLLKYLSRSGITEAKFIEYDSASVNPVIYELLKKGTNIELLLQHPENSISEYQKTKIIHKLRDMDMEFHNFKKQLKIFFYKDKAALRGRLLDNNCLCYGWYTYDRRINHEEEQVWGHENPTCILFSKDESFKIMKEHFDKVYINLKNNSETSEALSARLIS